MGTVASTRGQVKTAGGVNVIPDSAQVPAAHLDFLGITNAIEPRLVLRIPTTASFASLAPVEVGMVAVTTTAPFEVWWYTGTWEKIWPKIYNGTAAPAAGLGVDGDVYFQY